MSGRVVHFEIPFDDAHRAQQFYSGVFGWEISEMPGMQYILVSTGPGGESGPTEPGYIGGGMPQRSSALQGPTIVIDVVDIDKRLAQIQAAGGQVVQGRAPVGSMGYSAYFTDPEGNLIGLWETLKQ